MTPRQVATLSEHALNVSDLSWGADDSFLCSGMPCALCVYAVCSMRVCRVLYACMPHASAPCATASPHVPAVLLVAQCTPGTREAHWRKEASWVQT